MVTSKLEGMVAEWLKPVPHLPVAGQKWIAENVWWIVLVGAILSGIGALVLIGGILTMISFLGAATSAFGYYAAAQVYTGWSVLSSAASLLFSIAIIILMAKAVSPLKLMKKSGWNILFLILVVDAIMAVVTPILNFNMYSFIGSLIAGAISIAISAYFLYEIRSYFSATAASAKPVTTPQQTK